MKPVALVHVDFTEHLISILTQTYLEQAKILHMEVKVRAISGKSYVLTDRFISRGDEFLDVEKYSVLLDFFDLLEQTRIQRSLFYVKGDTTYLFGDVELELVFIHKIDS
jgi:hypothetical protein